jgi:putative ABC transport system permease protein
MSQLRQDAIFTVRLLLKNRTFSCITIATMALAIGSTTAVFSLIDAVLIRPIPFSAPDQLFYASDAGMRGPFEVLRSNCKLADYAGYLTPRAFNTEGRDLPERLKGAEVSANFFQVLGVKPTFGRTFAEDEDRPGRAHVAVLGHAFWQQRYSGRLDAVGQHIVLDESDYEIVGIMEAGFDYPAAGINVWVPMRLDPRIVGEYWGSGGVSLIARLRPGVIAPGAQAEMKAWIPRIRAMFPWRMPDAWGLGAGLTGLQSHLVADARKRMLLLLGAVILVLLIAVVNVANLMIGQAAAREKEFRLRASLGASPGRLQRQMLTEAGVIAVAAGALGIALAFGQLRALKYLLPADTPRLAEVVIDPRILAFTAIVSLGSGLLFGLLPAWRVRTERGLDNRRRTDAVLVTAEAAFATILLIGAGLLFNTLWNMLNVDPGFRAASIVTAELSPNRAAASSLEKAVDLYERVRSRIATYPGVTSVAAMNVLPLTPDISVFTAAIEDHLRPPQAPQIPLWSTSVTPQHLDTLGVRLLQGRGFTAADGKGAPPVVLISLATAHRYWPDQNPIGKRLRPVWQDQWRTIVGVVDDVRNYSMTGPPSWVEGEIYLPLAQSITTPQTISLVIHMAGSVNGLEKQLSKMVNEVCSNCAVSKIASMDQVVSDAVQAPRSIAWLVGGFALFSLGLAAGGIYGVVNHGVVRRTRELGVRLALGASQGHVAWLVMGSTLRCTIAGIFVGLSASWVLTRWIKSLLYSVPEHDPRSFAVAPMVLIAVALIASTFPIFRAIRIDPAKSLREE